MSPPTPDALRTALRRLPTGVIVASTWLEGLDYAMTANSFTSVCLDPPLVLVCVQTDTQFHEVVMRSGRWAVSVLGASQADVAERLSHRGRLPGHQLDGVRVERTPGGLARVADAPAWVECRTVTATPGGDHTIVVGEVVATGLVGDDPADPLVYWERGFHGLGLP